MLRFQTANGQEKAEDGPENTFARFPDRPQPIQGNAFQGSFFRQRALIKIHMPQMCGIADFLLVASQCRANFEQSSLSSEVLSSKQKLYLGSKSKKRNLSSWQC